MSESIRATADASRPLRVLAVIPGSEAKSSFIFARRQMATVAELGVDVRYFWLSERTSPLGVLSELGRLRRVLADTAPDILHAHYGTVTGLVCALAGGPPLVITYRGSDLNGSAEVSGTRSRAGVLLSQIAALRAAGIICVSERLRELLWWRRGEVVVIPSGVDTGVFRPLAHATARAELNWPVDERVVLFNSGSRSKLKRLDIALATAAVTERLVPGSRMEVLYGGVDPDRIALYMNAADCLLLASDAEGSPNVIKEALACDLPIVSVDVGDVRERVSGVSPGAIVERDPERLATAIGDPSPRRTLERSHGRRGHHDAPGGRAHRRGLRPRREASMTVSPAAGGQRLRVMHVINAMNLGGAEMVVLEHVRQAGANVETHLCAVNQAGWAMQEAERLGAHPLVLGKHGGRLGAIRRFVSYLRRERIDVVNGHNPSGGFYAALGGRLAGVPVVVRTEHSIRHPGKHSVVYDALLEPALTAMTHRVICVCEAVRRSQDQRMRWASWRFVTVMNGIAGGAPADTREATRAALGLRAGESVVLTVASLTPAKAQDVLVDAFAVAARQREDVVLLLAGDGPLRAPLEARVRSLGLERRVRFLGVRKDVRDLLAAADVFVLSSVREGLSMSILEAMRAGRASVVTDVGGNAEAVTDGVNGLVVPPSDPGALGAALVAALVDPARLENWGLAARRRWEVAFTAEHMVRTTEALYRSGLLRKRPSPGA